MFEALNELRTLLRPLESAALTAVVGLVRTVVTHPDGALVAAQRATAALAAKAAIRGR